MLETNLDRRLELATCPSYRDTKTTLWSPTIQEFQKYVHQQPFVREDKDGPGFLIGPCTPTRKNENLPYATVAVIDADKTLSKEAGGKDVEGAPEVARAHYILSQWNLTHFIYTTHSHKVEKNRYRVVFPITTKNKHELTFFINFIIGALQNADFPIALPRESCVWSQRWNLPVVGSHTSSFETFSHIGLEYTIEELTANVTSLVAKESVLPPARIEKPSETGKSLISQFNDYYPLPSILESHGYEFKYETAVENQIGEIIVVRRFLAPNSTSGSPGVVVWLHPEAGYLVYSHHQSDPLCIGKSLDSYDVQRILLQMNHDKFRFTAAQMVRDKIVSKLTVENPLIMEQSSKFRILNISHDDFGYTKFGSMDRENFAHFAIKKDFVPVETFADDGGKIISMMPINEFWLKSNDSILYNGVTYQPKPLRSHSENPELTIYREGRPYLNKFHNWGVIPKKGKWPILEWHLLHTVCGSNKDQYNYLLNWYAHLFQNPSEKPETAIVLKGKKGTGKSKPFTLIGYSLGNNMVVLGNNTLLTGRFNQHITDKLMLIVEESFWAGHHKEEGVLKHMITDPDTTFEEKGKTPFRGKSYIRIILITNEDWAAPVSEDERRFFIPSMTTASFDEDIKNGKKGNFFPGLFSEMSSGGIQAFVHDMVERPIRSGCLRDVPETDQLKEQRVMSLDSLSSWLISSLTRRQLPVTEKMAHTTGNLWGSGGMLVPDQFVRESAMYYVPHNERSRGFDWRLESKLMTILGPDLCYRDGMNRVFGPIDRCQQAAIDNLRLPSDIFNRNERRRTPFEVKGQPDPIKSAGDVVDTTTNAETSNVFDLLGRY